MVRGDVCTDQKENICNMLVYKMRSMLRVYL